MMSFDDTINAYFVTTTPSPPTTTTTTATTAATATNAAECNAEDFDTALKYLKNHIPEENIREIKASEGFPLIASGRLTKKDVFVFDRFEGDLFQQLQQTKSLIVGPKCLISCLIKCEPIPLGTSPVYTTAMRNLQISATGITPQKKERLRVLIQWMGGHYFQNFGRSVTHLISNTIKSTKYEHATLNGIAVMHVDWVQRVWERSCAEDVGATDHEFDKYRLPIFFGTNITCTGLDTEKKNEVMRLVNENGGTYHSAFRSQQVDIVITAKDKTKSDKYKAAVAYNKDILLPEWIFDSVAKGFALPTKGYHVKPLKVSTPTKTDQSIADFTQISDISRISVAGGSGRRQNFANTLNDTAATVLNETQQSQSAFKAPEAPGSGSTKSLQRTVLTKQTSANAHYRLVYDEICPKAAKKAGNFLDGCCIYLSGFRLEEREKLNRILNVGGATRYDVVNEKITHIIVGQLDDGEYRAWKRDGFLTGINVVRLNWLLESIKLKQPASEVVYRMSLPDTREPDAPSPSSKKTLRSMNHSFKQPDLPIKKKLFDSAGGKDEAAEHVAGSTEAVPVKPLASSTEMPLEEDEQNLIAQYSQENVPSAAVPMPQPQPPVATGQAAAAHMTLDDNTLTHPIASSTILPPNDKAAQPQQQPQPQLSELTSTTSMSTIDYENLNFFQGISLYIDKQHFEEHLYSQMLHECEAAQGNVVEATYRDTVDYAIVSFETTKDERALPVKARHIVTELYVENCLKANKLVPIEYYHKHIPVAADASPLKGMTIVISTYTGLERDFIDSLAQVLGAKVNNNFVKKERPLLVCPAAEGSKYDAALKWRYPVVQSDWLVQCAARGQKLEYGLFLVGECANDFPPSPTLRERNGANRTTSTPSVPPTAQRQPAMAMDVDVDAVENNHFVGTPVGATKTPSPLVDTFTTAEFTPLRNKRVSELAGPSRNARSSIGGNLAGPDSPQTPQNNATHGSVNYDFLEKILTEIDNEAERECMREVIEEMRNNRTPELERIRRQACTPINRKVPTPKGIPDFCTTPEFEKRMADEFERRWRLPVKKLKPNTPIDVLRKRVMRATCLALGLPFNDDDEQRAQVPTASLSAITTNDPKMNASCSDSSRSRRISSSNATMTGLPATPVHRRSGDISGVGGPRSIFATLNTSASSNASDTYVPGTQHTPNTSRDAHATGMGQRASLGKSTINFDKITFEETTLDGAGVAASAGASVSMVKNAAAVGAVARHGSTIASSSPEVKQITEYLKSCESRRESIKRNEQRHDGAEMMETEAHYVQPFESEQFGIGTEEVGWRDPAEFSLERRAKAKRTMQYPGTPRFSISCSDEQTREDVIEKILKLGGEVCENLVNFDPQCTHFICERPNRGEKIIGCISSGKWVLGLNYIEECHAKDVFVDEELYEWGNCRALNLPQIKQDEQVIAHAAHSWRKKLSASTVSPNASIRGAFSGFRAVLRIPERTYDAMKNIITAGKGVVIDVKPPFNEANGCHLATHCFVDVKKTPLIKQDYDFLRRHKVPILTHMYINAYLMGTSEEDTAKFEVKM